MEKWRDFLRVEWWKDCGVETKNLWRNPWKIRQMPAAVSTACGNAFAQPSTGDSTAAEDASGKSLAAANFFLHMGFPQLVENGVENRKFSVEKRWKARIFKEIPRFHRKRQTEKSGREKESVAEPFSHQAAPAERSWRDFRACFASVRTHLACIFSEIFQENTRKSTKDFLRFSFHLSKNLTAQSAYAQMQNRLSQRARSLLSRCPQTAKFPAPCFWRAEQVGEKSDSFSRAERTRPLRPVSRLRYCRFGNVPVERFQRDFPLLKSADTAQPVPTLCLP